MLQFHARPLDGSVFLQLIKIDWNHNGNVHFQKNIVSPVSIETDAATTLDPFSRSALEENEFKL